MPNQFSHPWKKKDIDFLITNFRLMSYQDIGTHLNRSYSSDLLVLGITPRKSLIIKPPNIPNKYFWHYIRGFFDGDGCVHLFRNRYPSHLNTYFYTGSPYMAEFLWQKLSGYLVDYKGTIMKKRNKNAFVIHFGQKHSEVIFRYMYNNATIFMNRKYSIFLKGINTNGS